MPAISLVRRRLDPRLAGSIRLLDERLETERIPCTENEGDVRGMALLKDSGTEWIALSCASLDGLQRAFLRVRGALEVVEPSAPLPDDEMELAKALSQWISSRGSDASLVVVGESEQDTGRRQLPSLLGCLLGRNVVRGVVSLRLHGERVELRIEGEGTRTLSAPLPLVVVAHESAALGEDPSDAYDLIERFEREPARLVDFGANPTPLWTESDIMRPAVRETGALRPLDEDVVDDAFRRIVGTKA